MDKYKKYFLMNEQDVIEYVKEKIVEFKNCESLEADEIGDGNLNYVFRVKDKVTKKSVIIKQAGEQLRISSDMKLPISRGKHEYNTYVEMFKLVLDMVPKMYFYDDIMCVIAMEDMNNYRVMRNALIERNIFVNFSEQITSYLSSLLYTTEMFNSEEKKQNVVKFNNPCLCKITEDLVFSYPYCEENKTNEIIDSNKKFVKEKVFDDEVLKLEVGKLKYKFMNCTQALIHGDLHTGSIFINEDNVCIFDPEFSFFGPIGYDIGNVIANLIFAFLSNYSNDNSINNEFNEWVLNAIQSIIDKYIDKFNRLYTKANNEDMFYSTNFRDYMLEDILSDSAGYTGTEIIRRIVGMAKNKDFTIINNIDKRSRIERVGILIAKELIINREYYKDGKSYRNLIIDILEI